MLRSAVAVVLGLAFALPASAETLTLTSQYDVSGTNTNGSKYTVKVSIEVISDATFNIRWDIAGSTYTGFGMRMNDALAATYTINGKPGLVIYKVGDNGVLDGLWARAADPAKVMSRVGPDLQ
jgi:hypothetical protein